MKSGAVAAAAGEVLRREGQVHVLGGVAVLVVDPEGAHARGERARRVRVGAALRPSTHAGSI